MYTFKNGSEIAQIDDRKVHLNLSVFTKKVGESYIINIPSLAIHSYTKNENEIQNRIKESLDSFFRYWLKNQGKQKLIEHMLALGFSLSGSLAASSHKPSDFEGKRTKLNEDLVIL